MKTKELLQILLFGLTPILLGVFIYLVSRNESTLVFKWLTTIGVKKEIMIFRDYFSIYKLPNWVKYNLPDFLWSCGFTSTMIIIWSKKQSILKNVYIYTPLFLGGGIELIQLINPKYGTFDLIDVFTYIIATFFSIRIINNINNNKYEKQNHTYFKYFFNSNFHFISNWVKRY